MVQCHRNRLFSPMKIDCFGGQTQPFETQPTKIHLYHTCHTLDLRFKTQQSKTNAEYFFKIDLTYFHSARPPVIPHLRFRFSELQSATHHILLFGGRLYLLFLLMCFVVLPYIDLSCSTVYAIHMPTRRGKLSMTLAMCSPSKPQSLGTVRCSIHLGTNPPKRLALLIPKCYNEINLTFLKKNY